MSSLAIQRGPVAAHAVSCLRLLALLAGIVRWRGQRNCRLGARSRRRMRSPVVGEAISSVGGASSTVVESSLSRTILGTSVGCGGRASVGGAKVVGSDRKARRGGRGPSLAAANQVARQRPGEQHGDQHGEAQQADGHVERAGDLLGQVVAVERRARGLLGVTRGERDADGQVRDREDEQQPAECRDDGQTTSPLTSWRCSHRAIKPVVRLNTVIATVSYRARGRSSDQAIR